MKYQESITINLPREEVIEKFSEPKNLKHWQKGFIFMKPLNGTLGEVGSQNLLKFKINKREIEMTETILKNTLPEEFNASYKAAGVYNIQQNHFEKVDEKTTQWTSHSQFQFSGFMKLIGTLMPGAFKKQSREFMTDFKAFAEDGKSVLDKKD
ncbi:SRPBCC family protein [Gramella sp. AN32]|uniref:SRPBCC family protein n=1 Tax=Christiangramia antarctica TaxID=2058158 RepID=A0ABW5X5D7_9FLAO|nr:SRPBCC family protein [Gramella sp. AN32]MCM4157659.1 SRPBCC family protein [Gramella sp. AN32]